MLKPQFYEGVLVRLANDEISGCIYTVVAHFLIWPFHDTAEAQHTSR